MLLAASCAMAHGASSCERWREKSVLVPPRERVRRGAGVADRAGRVPGETRWRPGAIHAWALLAATDLGWYAPRSQPA